VNGAADTIVVEEHFALPVILERTAGIAGPDDADRAKTLRPLLLDLGDRRLEAMDEAGIDMQVISHTAPGPEWLDADEAEALVREANDVLLDAVVRRPDRLAGLACLPVTAPSAAADELRRSVGAGLKGAVVNGSADGRFLDDPVFADLLACVDELSVPLYIHPGIPPEAVREAYYGRLPGGIGAALATAAWGWHAETAVHLLRMMVTGVFDAHPALQVVIGHMGEMLPVMAARAETVLGPRTGRDRPLRAYFADNVHITTSGIFDHVAFQAAVALVGSDRMMLSVDFPYAPAAPAMALLAGLRLTADDRVKLAGANAARLFDLQR
jgi:predicted TIM-barrel fold metal-dependent hydrolase